MRKLIREGKGPNIAKVIPISSKQVKIEMGVDEEKNCIYLKMSGFNPCVAMTAERAEELAVDLQNFVFELRNGGRIG